MRLWSLHPRYLDARGLVALWREGLLAQAVLRHRTRGYRHHPQLARFRECRRPVAALASYLVVVQMEAARRGYSFDRHKIARSRWHGSIRVTRGQLTFECRHLLRKLRVRDPGRARVLQPIARVSAHPLFRVAAGKIATWERVPAATRVIAKRTVKRGARPRPRSRTRRRG